MINILFCKKKEKDKEPNSKEETKFFIAHDNEDDENDETNKSDTKHSKENKKVWELEKSVGFIKCFKIIGSRTSLRQMNLTSRNINSQ